MAFGITHKDLYKEISSEYFVRLVIEFNIWSKEKYKNVRKAKPDIVPSVHQLNKHWINFSNLKIFCKAYSVRHTAKSFFIVIHDVYFILKT